MLLRTEDSDPPTEEMDPRFAESEDLRWSTFDESRDQQAKEFTDAEVLRWEGEKAREVRFDETMTTFEDEFATSQADKDTVFRNSEARHDDISRANEVERNEIFRRREANHEEAFRRGQDAMEKQSEWYDSLRVQLLEEGHGMREEGVKKLEKAMCDELDTILRLQQDAYIDAEHRRDKLVDDAISKVNSMQNGVNGSLEALVTEHERLDDSVQHVISEISAAPPQSSEGLDDIDGHIMSVSTTRISNSPPLPGYVGHGHCRVRSRSASREPVVILPGHRHRDTKHEPLTPLNPIGIPADDGVKSLTEPIPQASYTLDIREEFREGQRHREETFKQDEMDRERRFNEAESDRDKGEDKRRATFSQIIELHEMGFREASIQWEEYFGLIDCGRAGRGRRRDQQFNDAQGRRSSMFGQFQSWSRQRYETMDEKETHLFNTFRNRLTELDDAQKKSFDEAKEQESSAFNKSQAGRESKLRRVHNWPTSILPPRKAGGAPPFTLPSHDGTFQSGPVEPAMDIGRSPTFPTRIIIEEARSRSRSRPTAGPAFPPQIFSVPPHVLTPLPVPGDNMRKRETATSFRAAQLRRQFNFEKSQADRKNKFEGSARKRQQVFSVKEAKRQQEFEKEQRSRREIYADGSRKRAAAFAASQVARERTFRTNEENRESAFLIAEEQRTNEFTEAQVTRNNEFHELHKTLQRQCVESESRRRSEFDRWERGMRDMMRRRDRHWKERFDTEEQERDERFLAIFRHVFPGNSQ